MGLPETVVDRLAKRLSYYDAIDQDTVEQVGLDADSPAHLHLLRLVDEIKDFPRHLSIHPGGFLLVARQPWNQGLSLDLVAPRGVGRRLQ